ncbi:MAG TPA: hypothetical protein VJT73_09935 [Polyangiaceae bacterium]|nr:hypothetical protein [Polyangiaceae bacterium]
MRQYVPVDTTIRYTPDPDAAKRQREALAELLSTVIKSATKWQGGLK